MPRAGAPSADEADGAAELFTVAGARGRPSGPGLVLPTTPGTSMRALPGRTLHPDEERAAAEARAREVARVGGRVTQWLEGAGDQHRARSGAVGPEAVAWGHALESVLNGDPKGSPVALGVKDGNAGYKKSYLAMAERFGKGSAAWVPGSTDPVQSDRLKELNAPEFLKAAVQAQETMAAVKDGRPLFFVTLELVQAVSGEVLSAELTTRSGNERFDDFVLASVPVALTKLPPPPAPRPGPLKASWEVEGWLVANPTALNQVLEHVAFADNLAHLLAPSDPATSHFEYRARLLAANR